ncbi:siderophore-interacting protein [Streptomyces sp. NPDC059873]
MTDAPFQFFTVEVLRTERVTPSMARIVLGGPDLSRMASAGRDQRVKLFLPRPGEREPVMPDPARADWYDAWRELDPGIRGVMRTYTVRELRRDPHELVIDFALHGTEGKDGTGPGTRPRAGTAKAVVVVRPWTPCQDPPRAGRERPGPVPGSPSWHRSTGRTPAMSSGPRTAPAGSS